MPSPFSLCWRVLLIAALVLNPMAAATASMAMADASGKAGQAAETAMSPCHDMLVQRSQHHDPAPMKQADPSRHGCDCGNPACQFAACCVGALNLASLRFAPPAYAGAQALPALDVSAAPAPPPARMIRPPIA